MMCVSVILSTASLNSIFSASLHSEECERRKIDLCIRIAASKSRNEVFNGDFHNVKEAIRPTSQIVTCFDFYLIAFNKIFFYRSF